MSLFTSSSAVLSWFTNSHEKMMYEFTARKPGELVVTEVEFRDLPKMIDRYGQKGFVITLSKKKPIDGTKKEN